MLIPDSSVEGEPAGTLLRVGGGDDARALSPLVGARVVLTALGHRLTDALWLVPASNIAADVDRDLVLGQPKAHAFEPYNHERIV